MPEKPEFVLYCRGVMVAHMKDVTYSEAMERARVLAQQHRAEVVVKGLHHVGSWIPRG